MTKQLKDKVFRTRAEKLGGHWHVRVFSADRPDHTFANMGTLVMDDSDYMQFCIGFKAEHLAATAAMSRDLHSITPEKQT